MGSHSPPDLGPGIELYDGSDQILLERVCYTNPYPSHLLYSSRTIARIPIRLTEPCGTCDNQTIDFILLPTHIPWQTFQHRILASHRSSHRLVHFFLYYYTCSMWDIDGSKLSDAGSISNGVCEHASHVCCPSCYGCCCRSRNLNHTNANCEFTSVRPAAITIDWLLYCQVLTVNMPLRRRLAIVAILLVGTL